jgi:hypothetical protein
MSEMAEQALGRNIFCLGLLTPDLFTLAYNSDRQFDWEPMIRAPVLARGFHKLSACNCRAASKYFYINKFSGYCFHK